MLCGYVRFYEGIADFHVGDNDVEGGVVDILTVI